MGSDFGAYKNKNVVILGGLGFIGSNLAIQLVSLGAKVTLVDSMLPQYGGNLTNIEPIEGRCRVNFSDIRDSYSLNYLVKDADYIFSMAGQTSHIDSMNDPTTDLEINCRSQLSLLEDCRQNNFKGVIVYASTRQVYGRPNYLPVDEKHPTEPVDVNGINKLAAENYYTVYSKVHKMHCVSLRLTNTYGPRQHLRGNTQGFAGIFIRKALSGEPIKLFGNGVSLRDFNYVDDVVEAFLLSGINPDIYGKTFNLGSDERVSIKYFVETLNKICALKYEPVDFPPEHAVIDIGDFYADFSEFNSLTGWKPKTNLEQGLKNTIAYFKPRQKLYW